MWFTPSARLKPCVWSHLPLPGPTPRSPRSWFRRFVWSQECRKTRAEEACRCHTELRADVVMDDVEESAQILQKTQSLIYYIEHHLWDLSQESCWGM